MDAPPIQYARTEDGVNIAYWTLGEGPPIAHLHSHALSHLSLEWDVPAMRSWYEQMARDRTVVRLNLRGGGLSDRDVPALGIEEYARDIDAVADATGFGRFALMASNAAGAPGIHYAATRPDRVARLVLFDATPDQGAGRAELMWRLSAGLREFDIGSFATLLLGHGLLTERNPQGEQDVRLQALLRNVFESDQHPGIMTAFRSMNVSDRLSEVQCPTLVVGRRDGGFADPRALAAGIPRARLAYVEGTAIFPYFQDMDAVLGTVLAFLEEEGGAREEAESSPVGAFRTLLFTNLESSTALTQALGDAKAQEVLHGHNTAVRAALAAHDGEEVKHTGDGIFAAFGSAVSAGEAALQIQRALAGAEVRVRIGLNAGEPIAEDDDYFGTAVQLAARVCDRAEPGQVLVSNVVRELCAGKTFAFTDQGEATLKGFPEPVRLFVVGEMASDDQGEGA